MKCTILHLLHVLIENLLFFSFYIIGGLSTFPFLEEICDRVKNGWTVTINIQIIFHPLFAHWITFWGFLKLNGIFWAEMYWKFENFWNRGIIGWAVTMWNLSMFVNRKMVIFILLRPTKLNNLHFLSFLHKVNVQSSHNLCLHVRSWVRLGWNVTMNSFIVLSTIIENKYLM